MSLYRLMLVSFLPPKALSSSFDLESLLLVVGSRCGNGTSYEPDPFHNSVAGFFSWSKVERAYLIVGATSPGIQKERLIS